MPRKTYPVVDLITSVNKALATVAPGNTPEYRRGVAAVLESALHATGNYRGYRYLDGPWVEGVTDETRRCYYA